MGLVPVVGLVPSVEPVSVYVDLAPILRSTVIQPADSIRPSARSAVVLGTPDSATIAGTPTNVAPEISFA
jgi:hypothetical protein